MAFTDGLTNEAAQNVTEKVGCLVEKRKFYHEENKVFITDLDVRSDTYLSKLQTVLTFIGLTVCTCNNLIALRCDLLKSLQTEKDQTKKNKIAKAQGYIDDIEKAFQAFNKMLETEASYFEISKDEILGRGHEGMLSDFSTLKSKVPDALSTFVEIYGNGRKRIKAVYNDAEKIYNDFSNWQKNRVVYQQNDPRLEYILDYSSLSDIFNLQNASTALQESIFAQLRDREKRDQFRIDCGFSWKDLVDILTYDCFVAKNKENVALENFLATALLDIYNDNDHGVWVAALSPQEAQYANEDAKRLGFLIAEEGLLEITPNLTVPNAAV